VFSRRFISFFSIMTVVLLGTGFFTARYLAGDLQNHLQTETNRLAYSRVLLSTHLLDDAISKNDYVEIKRIIEGLSEDSEISCIQYRDDRSLISSHINNVPCKAPAEDGLFSITLGSDEHGANGQAHVERKLLEVEVKGESTRRLGRQVKFPFLFLGIEFLVALLLVGLYFTLSNRALSNFLIGSLKKIANGEKPELPRSMLLESKPVEKSLLEIEKNLEDYRQVVSERVESEVLGKVAAQVSHDVRAPLGALELVIGNLKSLSGEDRAIINASMNRIRDISDTVLTIHRQTKTYVNHTPLKRAVEPPMVKPPAITIDENLPVIEMDAAIEEIVREKRLTLPDHVRIDYVPGGTVAVRAEAVELKRILSNLLNNAIDACVETGGVIRLLDRVEEDSFVLTIQDSGKGISADDLSKIGAYGVTIGKTNGNGIGLNHAIETARAWGGDVLLESQLGQGTSVHLTLKTNASSAAAWKNRRVIALGLKGRELAEVKEQSEFIHAFYAFAEFRKYYSTNFADLADVVFVVRDSRETGEWTSVLAAVGVSAQMAQFSHQSRFS
jgi:signal transduction histidine kinase